MLEEAVLLKHMKIPTPKRLMGLILGGPTVNKINVCRVQPTLASPRRSISKSSVDGSAYAGATPHKTVTANREASTVFIVGRKGSSR